jgi:ureidoacrylate peracid hydrolase
MDSRFDETKQSQRAAQIDVRVIARPSAIDMSPAQTALIVVDMQNGYCSPGGYREIVGRDISGIQQVLANNVRIIEGARAAGLTIVYLQNGWDKDLKDSGGPTSPNWHKSNPLKLMRQRPELRGEILTHGSWDYEFAPKITPRADELVVPKARYSGFCGTNLDSLLKARNIRYLIVTGVASNVCVETTIREAYHREYFCLLVDDAAQSSGPRFLHDAALYNVETFFGWVTTTDSICDALANVKLNPT